MLRIENLVFDAWGRRFFDTASVAIPAGAKVGLVGRNGVGKSTLFKLILGELAPHERRNPACRRRRDRIGRSGASGHAGQPARHHPGRRYQARGAERRAGDRRARGTCRHLPAAQRDRRRPRAGARRRNPQRPRLLQRRPRPADGGVLRRLAHAGGAGGGAVRRARPAAARRADQLPRSGRRAVAGGAAEEISAHRADHQPRPRAAEQFGRRHPAPERRQARLYTGGYDDFERGAPRRRGCRPRRASSRKPSARICRASSTASAPRPARRRRRSRA